jgi:tRNA(fMet)-specific endonuclease VapC
MSQRTDCVVKKFAKCKPGEVSISSITWAELCCGMDTQNHENEIMGLLEKLMPRDFGVDAGIVFGQLSRQFPNRKSSFDRMIAAHALALDVILVTNNLADFEMYRPAGLVLENWTL